MDGHGWTMPETTCVKDDKGVSISVCTLHELEYCHKCTIDFRELNEMARMDAIGSKEVCSNPGCSSSGATKKCARCHNARYCSRDCQKAHWKNGHKAECVRPEKETYVDIFGKTVQVWPYGTKVMMEDRSGRDPPQPLFGTIIHFHRGLGNVKAAMDQDDWDGEEGLMPMYTVKYASGDDGTQAMPADDLHSDFVKV